MLVSGSPAAVYVYETYTGEKSGIFRSFSHSSLEREEHNSTETLLLRILQNEKGFKIYLTLFNNRGEDLNILKIYRREIFLCYFIFQDYLGT
jgi:hypothetical protein